MKKKRCSACGQSFQSYSQVPNQSYCSSSECQRERRRRWQKEKLKTDPDYRDNQSRAQQAWVGRNPNYWSDYRDKNPKYVEKNRIMQRERTERNRQPPQSFAALAKMDASTSFLPVASGVYRLRPAATGDIAKMDECLVEIRLLSIETPFSE